MNFTYKDEGDDIKGLSDLENVTETRVKKRCCNVGEPSARDRANGAISRSDMHNRMNDEQMNEQGRMNEQGQIADNGYLNDMPQYEDKTDSDFDELNAEMERESALNADILQDKRVKTNASNSDSDLSDYLSKRMGQRVRIEFLVGERTIERVGTIMQVGDDFIVLKTDDNKEIISGLLPIVSAEIL